VKLPDERAAYRGLLEGDQAAFDRFFNEFFPRLYRFILTRVGDDHEAAQALCQQALVQGLTRFAKYRGEAALFTWLCTFCRHEISAYYRREGRAQRQVELREDSPEVRAALDLLAQDTPVDPERLLQSREVARLVQTTLDHLPRRYGDALEWKYVEGLSVAEIAGRLSVGPKAAESLLTRAREAFREGFGALCQGTLPWVREVTGP